MNSMPLLFLNRADVESLHECIEVVEQALRALARGEAVQPLRAAHWMPDRSEGAVADDHILGELGDLLEGKIPGRRSAEEITLFKSLGIAVEDLAAGRHVYRKAVAKSGEGSSGLVPEIC
jgi:ornithine cyclodeaminase/alanine dehydrogenase-like protein (mu-crystallin family)